MSARKKKNRGKSKRAKSASVERAQSAATSVSPEVSESAQATAAVSPAPSLAVPSAGRPEALAFALAVLLAVSLITLLTLSGYPEGIESVPGVGYGALLVMFSAVALAGLATTVFFSKKTIWLLAALLFTCSALSSYSEVVHLPTGLMKVYPHDLLFLAVVGSLIVVHIQQTARDVHTRYDDPATKDLTYTLVVPLLFMMIVGVVGLLRGLKAGIDFNDAFGDFRRGYFYLLAILIPLLIGQYRRTAKMVDATMRAAALVLITAGLLQLALGKLDRRMVLDAAHILSHFLLVVVSYLFFRELPFLFLPGYSSNRRLLALAQCFAASMVVILGNFRSVWLAFFGACLIMFFVVAGKMKAYFIGLAILGTTLLVLGIGLLWTYPIGDRGKTLGDEISLKLKHTKEMDRDLNIIWRKQSYTAALESWAAQPILGTGLGKMNDFFVLKSDGNIRLASRNRPHNGYLWFLQTVGITGLLVVLWFHSTIFFRLAGRVRQSSQGKIEFIPLYWGAFGFYCCFMIASGFDVLLEMATRILTISIVMGAALLPLALRDDPATQTDQSKTSFD